MAGGYRRGTSSEYGGRTIRVRVKATPRRRGYVATRRDIGKPGIGPKLIPITEKGALTKHGWSTKKGEEARHRALRKAVDEFGALSVFRKLKAQETLRKRTQPKAREIFASDADWVRDQFKVDGFAS